MTSWWFLRLGVLQTIIHDGFWKNEHDFLLVIHCNFLFVMHGSRHDEVLQAGYDDIVMFPLEALPANFHDAFWKSDHDFLMTFYNANSFFFRAFNVLNSKDGTLASEEVVLSLIRAKSLPILLYATEACSLLSRNRSSFEFSVTRLFIKLFRTTSPVDVKCC